MTLREHSLDDGLSVVRVRISEAWVTLWSNSYTIEEVEALVPHLIRMDLELLARLKIAWLPG